MRTIWLGLFMVLLPLSAYCGETMPSNRPNEDKLPASYFAEMADVKRHYQLFDDACDLLHKAITRSKTDNEKLNYQVALAETFESAGKAREAAELWDTLGRSPNPVVAARAKIAIAWRLAAEQKTAEAIECLESVAMNCPLQNYRATAADRLAKLINKKDKLGEYQARLNKEPKNRELLSLVLALQNDDPKARAETLARVYEADKHDLEIMQRYGASLLEADELDKAGKFYQDMATDYPIFQRLAYEQLARIAARKGAAAEAVEMVLRSASDLPDDVEKSLYLTRHFLELNVPDQAEKYGRQAYERAKGEAMKAAAGMELGEALYRLNRLAEALKLLRPIAEQPLWRGLQTRAQAIVNEISKRQTPGGDF